jgi:hypothetical protein
LPNERETKKLYIPIAIFSDTINFKRESDPEIQFQPLSVEHYKEVISMPNVNVVVLRGVFLFVCFLRLASTLSWVDGSGHLSSGC